MHHLPLQTLLLLGAFGGLVIVLWAFSNWRLAVKIAFVVLLFEGAIRKWGFPSGQELVYFLKDIFLAGAYLKFFLFPDPELRSKRLNLSAWPVTMLCMVVVLAGLNPNIGSVFLALYGIKVYLYYIPLAFMMPYLFRSEREMVRNLCWYAVLALPICALGFLQYRAGPGSWLNVYSNTGTDTVATTFGYGEEVRITGTFSYLTGHTTFVVFFTALHIALLMGEVSKFFWWVMLLDIPLLLANAFMGGSRASIACNVLLVVVFAVASVFTKLTTRKNAIFILAGSVTVALFGAGFFFVSAMEHWKTRFESSDTMTQRVYELPVASLQRAISDSGITGYGIGMTHPAVDKLRGVLQVPMPRYKAPVFDSEAGQVTAELGILGALAWYGLRIFALWQCFKSFTQCPPGTLRTVMLAATLVQIPHFVMSVVFNHIANFLIFAAWGLCLIPYLRTIRQSRPVLANSKVRSQFTAPVSVSRLGRSSGGDSTKEPDKLVPTVQVDE